jgi:hypothetical protein
MKEQENRVYYIFILYYLVSLHVKIINTIIILIYIMDLKLFEFMSLSTLSLILITLINKTYAVYLLWEDRIIIYHTHFEHISASQLRRVHYVFSQEPNRTREQNQIYSVINTKTVPVIVTKLWE